MRLNYPLKRLGRSFLVLLGSCALYIAMCLGHGCEAVPPGGGGKGATSSASGRGGAGGLPDPVSPAEADSGSRLRAKWYEAADGAKQFAGFFDKERNEDCGFSANLDGIYRCVPAIYPGVPYYADPACMVPLMAGPESCDPLGPYRYVQATRIESCVTTRHAFPIGEEIAAPTLFYAMAGAQCTGSPPPMGWVFYATGPEVPAMAFVAAKLVTD